ncbi:MAG: YcaO-like family protein, partial [Paracoccaceae bacterium]
MTPLPFEPEVFGISRLASQGGLSQFGLPVWSAIRPNARSFVVTNGKGLTDEGARLTAAMEAAECACAENVEHVVTFWGSLAELQLAGAQVIELATCARFVGQSFDPHRSRGWVKGTSWPDREDIYAPFELVGLDYRVGFETWDHDSFIMGSGGLAAHVSIDGARLHALRELIEQEARLFLTTIPGYARKRRRFDPRAVLPDPCMAVLERLDALGISAELIDATTDIGVPVVLAVLHERGDMTNARFSRAGGCACAPTHTEAAANAFFEAIQTSVTDIAGARDDLSLECYTYRTAPSPQPRSAVTLPESKSIGETS